MKARDEILMLATEPTCEVSTCEVETEEGVMTPWLDRVDSNTGEVATVETGREIEDNPAILDIEAPLMAEFGPIIEEITEIGSGLRVT